MSRLSPISTYRVGSAAPGQRAARRLEPAVHALSDRFNVAVRPERVLRIPFRLDPGEALESLAECRLGALGTFVLGQEVDVGAAGREPLHVIPRLTRPFDVCAVLVGLFPRARYVEHVARIAVADGRVLLFKSVQRTFDLEQNDGRVRRSDRCRMLDDLLAQGRFDAREGL